MTRDQEKEALNILRNLAAGGGCVLDTTYEECRCDWHRALRFLVEHDGENLHYAIAERLPERIRKQVEGL